MAEQNTTVSGARAGGARKGVDLVGRGGTPGPARAYCGVAVEVVTVDAVRAPGLAKWLSAVAPPRARGGITIAIVPDSRVRTLNRRYRQRDAATDVLSFPSGEARWLGDVVIAAGMARRQAKAAGHTMAVELRVLALHGLLHLLGYDHERDNGRMERLERRLRRRGGLREGLIERGGRRR